MSIDKIEFGNLIFRSDRIDGQQYTYLTEPFPRFCLMSPEMLHKAPQHISVNADGLIEITTLNACATYKLCRIQNAPGFVGDAITLELVTQAFKEPPLPINEQQGHA